MSAEWPATTDASETEAASQRRTALAHAFPELQIESFEPLGEGWDSTVWVVNRALVFRFPKDDDVVPWLLREIALLPELHSLVPLPVPRFSHVWLGDAVWSMPFVGYPMLLGTPLNVAELTVSPPNAVADSLASFLSALHSFPVDRAVTLAVPRYLPVHWKRAHQALWDQVEESVYQHLTALERRLVSAFFRRFLDLLNWADFSAVLVHGDLKPGHVLVDERQSTALGVIDFGDMRLTDPALDFAQFPPWFAKAMLRAYSGRHDALFLERARYYGRLEAFRATLLGLDTRNDSLRNEGIAGVRRHLRDL
jgi:aminoglycoside 2''-phosphotransferase